VIIKKKQIIHEQIAQSRKRNTSIIKLSK